MGRIFQIIWVGPLLTTKVPIMGEARGSESESEADVKMEAAEERELDIKRKGN